MKKNRLPLTALICFSGFLAPYLLITSELHTAPSLSAAEQKPKVDLYGDRLPAGAIARVGMVRFKHGNGLSSLAFSKDARLLATSGGDRTICIWNVATGKEIKRFPLRGTYDCAGRVALSPNGKFLAYTNFRLVVLDISTGKEIFLSNPGRVQQTVAFADDGKTMLSSGYLNPRDNPFVNVWDTKTWRRIRTFQVAEWAQAFSADGKLAAVVKDRETVQIWNTTTGQRVRNLPEFPTTDWIVALSGRGLYLAADHHKDRRIRVWDLRNGKKVFDLPETGRGPNQLIFGPREKKLLIVNEFGSAHLYDLKTNKEVVRFPSIRDALGPFALSPDGKWLAGDRDLRLWDVATGKEKSFGAAGGRFVTFFRDGKRILTGGRDVVVAEATTGKTLRMLPRAMPYQPVFSSWHDTLLHFTTDKNKNKTVVRDVLTKRELAVVPAKWAEHSEWFSPDLKHLLWHKQVYFKASKYPPLQLYDRVTQKKIKEWHPPKSKQIITACFSLDGRRVVILVGQETGGGLARWYINCSTMVWDPESDETVFQLNGHPIAGLMAFQAFTVSTDNRLGVACDINNVRTIWDIATGRPVRRLQHKKSENMHPYCLSANGRFLAATGEAPPGSIHMYDLASGKRRQSFVGHHGRIASLAFSPDGTKLATAAYDGTTLIWPVPRPAGNQVRLSDKQLEQLWLTLASRDPLKAWLAVWQLSACGQQAERLLERSLQPPPKIPSKRLARLIANLGNNRYRERAKAQEQLLKLADFARPALRQALQKNLTLEENLRIRNVLARMNRFSASTLQTVRALAVLEYLGTPVAVKLVHRTTTPEFPAQVRQQAREALRRLRRHKNTP